MSKGRIISFVIVATLLWGIFYFVKIGFSDGRTITPNSLESWLWVPTILKDKSLERIGVVQDYHYSAGEASKPVSTSVQILSMSNKQDIEREVKQYFVSNGYKQNERKEFTNGEDELTFLIEKHSETEWMVSISFLE